jgi:hypothetical protein
MKRLALALLTTATGLLATSAALPAIGSATAVAAPHKAASTPDAAVEWNRFLLDLQAAPGNQPATVHPTYGLALTHAAIYDAVVSIDRSGPQYLTEVHGHRNASRRAAADAAAHDMLVHLYPALTASIDAEYASQLAELPGGHRTRQGIRVGKRVAAELIAKRANDGSSAPLIPFTPGNQPGDYQLTPPALAQPVFTHWRFVKPFVLQRADQFQPAAPPALTSSQYAAAINEVKTLGVAQGSTRTADQTQIGLFWNPAVWATWNRIAETAALERQGGLSRDARAFEVLNLTFADSVIAFYDAKYTYRLWRPITAIRNADMDGNPDTTADPNWTPLSNTAPDPSYPGAHGTIGAAGATVLASIYGDDLPFTLTSPALPGVERSFTSFSAAAAETSVSRIYNGNHTRIDQDAGEALGRHVAEYVLHN